MKILNLFIVSLLLFTGIFIVGRVEAQAEKTATPPSSYELFFPITPGKVLGDPLYPLKQFKESIRELITFGKTNKAEYSLTLSEKRLIEGEYLYNNKGYSNALKTMSNAQNRRKNAVSLYEELSREDNETADLLKIKIIESLDKQLIVLNSIKISVPSAQQKDIQINIDSVKDLLKQLKS